MQPGRLAVHLPADSIVELGVPGVKGFNETSFFNVAVSDPKHQLDTLKPELGCCVNLTLCPNEDFVLMLLPSRPEIPAHK